MLESIEPFYLISD